MTVQPIDRPGTGWLSFSHPHRAQRASRERGVTGLTERPVVRLLVEQGRCTGVETAGGERFQARRAVLSSVHVKHLVEMAPRAAWGDDFLYGVETWQPGVSMFATHYATTAPPRFPVDGGTLTTVAAGVPTSVERVLRIGPEV